MASDHSLTRRTVLQVAGAGALVLGAPAAFAAQASARAQPDAPAHLRRSSYLGFVGARFALTGGGELRLDAVQDLGRAAGDASLVDHEEAFVLVFSSAAGAGAPSGVHELGHPELGPIALFVSPVDRPGARARHEVLIDRTVRLAGALAAPAPATADLSPAAADDADAATAPRTQPNALGAPGAQGAGRSAAAAPPANPRPRGSRLRVRAKAHRAAGKVVLELDFPGGGLQAASVRLRRKGRTHAEGQTSVRRGRADLTLRPRHAVTRGTYELVVTATDREGSARTVTRTVTVR